MHNLVARAARDNGRDWLQVPRGLPSATTPTESSGESVLEPEAPSTLGPGNPATAGHDGDTDIEEHIDPAEPGTPRPRSGAPAEEVLPALPDGTPVWSPTSRSPEVRAASEDDGDIDSPSWPAPANLPPEQPKGTDQPEPEAVGDNSDLPDTKGVARRPDPRPPRDIGGRRNPPSQPVHPTTGRPGGSIGRTTIAPRPGLICRKPQGSLRWDVILSADQELAIEAVKQQDELLEMASGECPLASLAGRLFVEFADGQPVEVALFEGDPLIFKLNRDWKGDGRRVRRVTRGHFILITPREWTRSGHVPVEPDACSDRQFMAHYFFSDGSESSEQIGGFQEYEIALGAVGFELTGKSVFDDSEEGHLFVGTPPHLKPASGVVWARVGEESEDGWSGENFRPQERSLAKVLDGRQGRYFVRVYDANSDLLDSDQFRCLHSLQEIRVNEELYTQHTLLVPDPSGHRPTVVQFVGRDEAVVLPILPSGEPYVEDYGNQLVVQPHPDADALSYELRAGGDQVASVLRLPRVWWRMELDRSENCGEWRDTPIQMTRHEFRKHAESNAALRLRLPRRVQSILVGFDGDVNRRYPSVENAVLLPLADFLDYTHIDQRSTNDALFNVRVEHVTLPIVRVPSDSMPVIVSFRCEPKTATGGETLVLSWTTHDVEGVSISISPDIGMVEPTGSLTMVASETTTWELRLTAAGLDDVTSHASVQLCQPSTAVEEPVAQVRRSGGGWRRGKGFSRGELQAYGLTAIDAEARLIPFDRRRRSTHRANIEELGRLADA